MRWWFVCAMVTSACRGGAGVDTRPEPRVSEGADDVEAGFVYVCHGNRNPRWQRVGAPAADAHRRHGDRVSDRRQVEGEACDR